MVKRNAGSKVPANERCGLCVYTIEMYASGFESVFAASCVACQRISADDEGRCGRRCALRRTR